MYIEPIVIKGTSLHGTVELKIRNIVKAMQCGANYMFKNWAQANVELDRVTGPTIIYVLPPAGNLDFHYMQVKDSPEVQIAFVSPIEMDFDSTDNEDVIEQMKRLCIKFIKAVNDSGLFEYIDGKLEYKVLYDRLDDNVTGIVIEPPLKEKEGVLVCYEPQRTEDEEETANELGI